MKTILSYNVNGIRAALKKGWADWVRSSKADIICLQETKVQKNQLDLSVFDDLGYYHYWFSARKKGYSGVAILSKEKPEHVEYGCGIENYDFEGRFIRVDFKEYSVVSVYFPSGSSGEFRQSFKIQFLADFKSYIDKLKKKIPNLIISGDFNICHREIDIHNPVSNKNSSGFLPQERDWLSSFIRDGFVDSFRVINQNPDQYTWWSYRSASRARNKGWRIDYHMVSISLQKSIKRVAILSEANHSDHCPILLEMDF